MNCRGIFYRMSPKHLIVAALAALMTAPVAAQSVKAGIDAWQRADYASAVAIWRPLAERGDADAQFNLGQAYRLGRGVQISLSTAIGWFERAAASGHVDAQTTLGLLLFQNGSKTEGLKWLRQAADQNEARAQLVYGTALYNGDGVTQDRLLGYAYVSRSATQGLAAAQDTLGQLDQMMPAPDRQRALALARTVPKPAPTTKPRAEKPMRTTEARPPLPKAVAPKTGATGNWRIQLGAFSRRSAAEALYGRLAGKSALAGRHPIYVPVGPMTRLQVGPFASKAAAAEACSGLATACFPVPAK
jgi:cell division septation protein DedD